MQGSFLIGIIYCNADRAQICNIDSVSVSVSVSVEGKNQSEDGWLPITLALTLALIFCTRGRTRTGTAVRPKDFKSFVSTIPPPGRIGQSECEFERAEKKASRGGF